MSDPGFASLGPSLLARKGGAKPAMRPQVAPLVADESEIAALADEQLEDLGWNDMGDPDGVTGTQGGADIVPINADLAGEHIASGPGPIVRRQQRNLEERVLADAAMTGPDESAPERDHAEDEDDGADDAYFAAQVGAGADYAAEDYAADGYAAEAEADEDEDGDKYGDDAGEAAFAPLAPRTASAPRKTPVTLMPAPAPTPAVPAAHVLRAAQVPAAQARRRAAFTLRLDADRHLKLRLAATMQGVSAQALVTEALDRLLAEFDDLDIIANHLKRH